MQILQMYVEQASRVTLVASIGNHVFDYLTQSTELSGNDLIHRILRTTSTKTSIQHKDYLNGLSEVPYFFRLSIFTGGREKLSIQNHIIKQPVKVIRIVR